MAANRQTSARGQAQAARTLRCASGGRVLAGERLFLGQRPPQVGCGGFRTVAFAPSQERGFGRPPASTSAAARALSARPSFSSVGATCLPVL